jgi:chemotaxis-related protein WspD
MGESLDSAQYASGAVVDDCWNRIGVLGDGSCSQLAERVHCRNCPVYFAGAVALLDRPTPGNYLTEWTDHFAQPKRAEELDTESAVIFRLGGEWLALATHVVSEVTHVLKIHSLPHRRAGVVMGLASVRGELVVCVSLAHILGVAGEETARESLRVRQARLLVIRRDDVRLVCPVDEVYGIYRFQPLELHEVPATVMKATASYSKALLPWKNRSVGLLDDQKLFATLRRSIA